MNTTYRVALASLVLVASFLLLSPDVRAGGDKGWFGLGLNVEASGISLNPVIGSITVTKVVAGSPAASQGVLSGDRVEEVEGVTVAGCKAKQLQGVMRKTVGETLRMRLKRPNGEIYSAALIASPKSNDL